MNNRKIFVNFINAMFQRYSKELEDAEKLVTCDSMKNTEAFSLTHQKIVRDYMNLYTPTEVSSFHGLGRKMCSISLLEGKETKRQVIVMTPNPCEKIILKNLRNVEITCKEKYTGNGFPIQVYLILCPMF